MVDRIVNTGFQELQDLGVDLIAFNPNVDSATIKVTTDAIVKAQIDGDEDQEDLETIFFLGHILDSKEIKKLSIYFLSGDQEAYADICKKIKRSLEQLLLNENFENQRSELQEFLSVFNYEFLLNRISRKEGIRRRLLEQFRSFDNVILD